MAKENKEKKVLTDYEKAYKNFMDNYNDPELQDQFDGMVKTADRLKERINTLISMHNPEVDRESDLQELIFKSVLSGIMPTEAITKFKELNRKNSERFLEIESLKLKHREELELIGKYKDWTDKKLFQYWSIIKDLNEKTEPWLTWKRQFENRIF